MSINLITGEKKRVSFNIFKKDKKLVAPGSKWFYKFGGETFRKSDLIELMIKEKK